MLGWLYIGAGVLVLAVSFYQRYCNTRDLERYTQLLARESSQEISVAERAELAELNIWYEKYSRGMF